MKSIIEKLIFLSLFIFLSISELSAYNSNILKILKQEDAKAASNNEYISINQETQTIAFKPLSINEETCELEVGDLDVMAKEMKKQIKKIIEDIKTGGKEFYKHKKNQLLKETLTKLPAYTEFMYLKKDTKIIANIAKELGSCVEDSATKGIDMSMGGGAGDQGGEMRIGIKPKELGAIAECYVDALYPKNMTDEDQKLLKKLEKKWEESINTLLKTQLNLMIKNIQKPVNKNICTESIEAKRNDMSYLIDNIGSIYLLDNTNLNADIDFQIETEEEYNERIDSSKDVVEKNKEEEKGRIKKNEKTSISIGKESLSKQPLFTDMEEAPFKLFKSIVKKYMIDLSNTYGIYLNRETKDYVEIILTKLIFETNKKGEKDDFYTLIYKLSENVEYFNKDAEDDGEIIYELNIEESDFKNYSRKVNVEIVRDILNKTLLNAYSRYQKVQANKLNIYNANIPRIFEVNNKHIIQILMVDRYFYRYKKLLEEKYIKRIIYKKELEKQMIIKNFCIYRRTQMFEELCREVMSR